MPAVTRMAHPMFDVFIAIHCSTLDFFISSNMFDTEKTIVTLYGWFNDLLLSSLLFTSSAAQ